MKRENKWYKEHFPLLAILIVVVMISIFALLTSPFFGGAEQYLGSWKSSRGELIHIIKADLHPPPKSTITLSGGRKATLRLQIIMREGRSKYSYIAIDGGGIYNTDYGHAIIVWCSLHRQNVLVYIRKRDENIQLGYVGNFSSANEAFQTTHTKAMFLSPPKRWMTFRPAK